MKPVEVCNYSSTPFRGWVLCGIEEWPTHQAGVPRDKEVRQNCQHVVFGPLFGAWRECRLLVDLKPMERVTVALDALDAQPYQPKPPGAIDQYGRPVIVARVDGFESRQPLEVIGWESTGVGLRVHCGGRVDGMLYFDVWVDVAFGQPWAEIDVFVTVANPKLPLVTYEAPADLFLEWEDPTTVCMMTGFQQAHLVTQGDVLAHGKAIARTGAVYWAAMDEEPKAGTQSAYVACTDGVVALQIGAKSPMGLPLPRMGELAVSGHQFGVQWVHRTLKALDGPSVVGLGVDPNSARTGAQEDAGYAKGGECTEPVAILPSKYVALGMARRPCHFIEEDGRLLDRVERTKLVFWSGQPHWHTGVSPDQLGLPRRPNTYETEGWSGPDREHWFANRLWLALSRTARPALQRLAEHQAQLYLLQETVDPRLSTSGYSTARAAGWTCLVALNLIRLLKNSDLRTAVLKTAVDRLEMVYLPQLEAKSLADGARWAHVHPISDTRGKLGLPYVGWAQTWQEAVIAFGMYVLANAPEVQHLNRAVADRASRMAARFAINVIENGSDGDGSLGVRCWENVGVRADGKPLAPTERIVGIGVTYSDNYRHWAQPLAWWVAAQERHPGAAAHYDRLVAEAMRGNRDLAFLPPRT